MLAKKDIEHLAKTIEVDYGDTLSKRELSQLFQIDHSYSMNDDLNIEAYKEAHDQSMWEFLHAMDLFKVFLRDHRSMHLEALRGKFTYRVIRPDEHVQVALGHLRKQIEKGFTKAHQVLDSTAEHLLESAEKVDLTTARIRVSRFEEMVTSSSKRAGIMNSFKNQKIEEKPF